MPTVQNNAIGIHYEVHGTGLPVVLLHGGTVDFKTNYAAFGWIKVLNEAGFQVIGLDFRGHGKSDKPHERAAYGTAALASDALAVLDHLGIAQAAVVGYSIGSVVALHLLQTQARRFTRAVLVGTGDGLIGEPPHTFALLLPALAQVLDRSEYPKDLPKHLSAYWNFVTATGGDREALRALAAAEFPPLSAADAAAITVPTLVISGEKDLVLGQGPRLAAVLGQGQYLQMAGADHFSLAADAAVKAAVTDFLKQDADAESRSAGAV
ncbi:MAG: alpha/beta hydrolase [Pseudomonadota bacterium]